MNKPRILISIPTRHHVEIALDELEGLQALGYTCGGFSYAAKEGVKSKAGRFGVIIQNALALVKTARKFKPDVIYFNSRLEKLAGIRDFVTIGLFKTFYAGKVKFVIKSHGSDIDVLNDKQGFWGKKVMPYLKNNVSGWLFLSTEERNKVIKTGYLAESCIYTTKNIVRTQQFKPDANFRKDLNIPDNHQLLLFVGRTIKEKGVYEVIKAFAQIAAEHPDSTLIMVGNGSDYENLKNLTSSLKINSRVIFTGFIPEQDVVRYYSNCDVLVFPTYFPEGFPMALFNSVAAGMAIVTTPTRAATDYLTEPQNCLWVDSQNFNSVGNALNKLLRLPHLQNTMRQNNRIKANEFSRDCVSAELSEVLKKITGQ